MRVERLGQDKIRIFLTFDDLMERGIEKEDMWRDIPKVHELFNDMMDQAYDEVGFEINGPVAVEVFAIPAQGMVVIVTRGNRDHLLSEWHDHRKRRGHPFDGAYDSDYGEEIEEEEQDEVYEMEVTLEESDWILYRFSDFENLLEAIHRISDYLPEGGTVFSYKGQYFLQLWDEECDEEELDIIVALLSEYGEPSTVTPFMLDEYGVVIVRDRAVETLTSYFQK